MLNENIKNIRKAKGLSQEELAIRLHVVRQTISKWERGLSVPDSDTLIVLSDVLETPVSVLLGENVESSHPDSLTTIANKLEALNSYLAQRKEVRRRNLHWFLIVLCLILVALFLIMGGLGSPYLHWDYQQPENAVVGVILHACEWIFVRIFPLTLLATIVGIILTKKER